MSTMAIMAGRVRSVPCKVPWLVRFFDARLAALEDEHRKLSQQHSEQLTIAGSNPGCTLLDAPGAKDERIKADAKAKNLAEQAAKLTEKQKTIRSRRQFARNLTRIIHLN